MHHRIRHINQPVQRQQRRGRASPKRKKLFHIFPSLHSFHSLSLSPSLSLPVTAHNPICALLARFKPGFICSQTNSMKPIFQICHLWPPGLAWPTETGRNRVPGSQCFTVTFTREEGQPYLFVVVAYQQHVHRIEHAANGISFDSISGVRSRDRAEDDDFGYGARCTLHAADRILSPMITWPSSFLLMCCGKYGTARSPLATV